MAKNEDKYADFLNEFVNKSNPNKTPNPTLPTNKPKESVSSEFIPNKDKEKIDRDTSTPLSVKAYQENSSLYEEVSMSDLPLGNFYHAGTKIMFRDLSVKEVENYSTIDERNYFDFKDKLNEILDSCIYFVKADGTTGSYLDLKEGDRVWMVYMIREKTYPKGKVLSVKQDYEENGEKISVPVELIRGNMEIYRNEEIMDWFDNEKKCFSFETELRDKPYYLAPPTIGLKRCFDQYMKILHDRKEKINVKFFEIAPFLKPHVNYMDYDELEELKYWFENSISKEEFAFLSDLIKNNMKIGIRGLKKNMGKRTIRTYKMYPARLSTLFVLPNAFKLFLKKQV